MIDQKQIEQRVKEFNNKAETVAVEISELVFELNTRINCFYCGRYNKSWRCPPKVPEIDYKAMFSEFTSAMFIYQKFPINPQNKNEVRVESSLSVHRTMLDVEKFLYENNCPSALLFIGGSCKLCKAGCGEDRCNNPYMARMPVEATGINVVKTLEKKGVKVLFPPTNELIRVGLVVWY